MGLESITLSEIVQAEKDKYCMVSYIYGILKTKKNPHINKVVAGAGGSGERLAKG